jgi:hypothetical protein
MSPSVRPMSPSVKPEETEDKGECHNRDSGKEGENVGSHSEQCSCQAFYAVAPTFMHQIGTHGT